MREMNGRYVAGQYVYQNRAEDMALAVEALRRLVLRLAPSVLLFSAFCAAWAVVFGLALR